MAGVWEISEADPEFFFAYFFLHVGGHVVADEGLDCFSQERLESIVIVADDICGQQVIVGHDMLKVHVEGCPVRVPQIVQLLHVWIDGRFYLAAAVGGGSTQLEVLQKRQEVLLRQLPRGIRSEHHLAQRWDSSSAAVAIRNVSVVVARFLQVASKAQDLAGNPDGIWREGSDFGG